MKTDSNISGNDTSALLLAIQNKEPSKIKDLLDKGADPNAMSGQNITPLMLSIITNYVTGFQILLKAKAIDVNQGREDDTTALMLAIEMENLEMVVALLEKGADAHKANIKGETAITLAFNKGNKPIYELLLPHLVNKAATNSPTSLFYRQ